MKQIEKNVIAKLFLLTLYCCFISCDKTPKEKAGMVLIQGNDDNHSFWMDVSPVTVAHFREFVQKTHYRTQAEKFGDAGVFEFKTGDWGLAKGANWEYPFGKDAPKAKPNHPVLNSNTPASPNFSAWV